ncbi:rhomboid-like protein 14, mitochondrial [Gossypium arboreum]|uniref:rhomboid-like protein 14, mitochondrial n=1 Tax=Gossypium arboreum TaxID=29729 RepID=UPI0022F1D9BF|nr:rhomboid-like protein 14, mitochondrial [Gossypium arboreum]
MDSGRWRRGAVSHGMLPLLALHAVNEYYRLPWKPPVTTGLFTANTLIYLRPSFLDSLLPFVDEVWFNPHIFLKFLVLLLLHFGCWFCLSNFWSFSIRCLTPRSPAIVVAFLMKSKGWRLPQSYQWVKERRPFVDISQV